MTNSVRSTGVAAGGLQLCAFACLATAALWAPPAAADCTSQYPRPEAYWKLDSASQGALADSSGSHPGTVYGGAGVTPGLVGNALRLDGTNDYAAFDALPQATGGLTISGWVRFHNNPALANTPFALLDKWNSGARRLSFYLGNGSTGTMQASISRDGRTAVTATTTTPTSGDVDTWVHWALVFDGRYVKLYRNGAYVSQTYVGTTGATLFASTDPLWMGRTRSGTFTDGDVDEVAVWAQALGASQISSAYQRGVNRQAVYDTSTCGVAISPTLSSASASATEALADGSQNVNVTVAVRDIWGQAVPNATVTIESNGTYTQVGPPRTTNASGLATLTVGATLPESVTLTVFANATGTPVQLQTTLPLQFISPAALYAFAYLEFQDFDTAAGPPILVFAEDVDLYDAFVQYSAGDERIWESNAGELAISGAVVGDIQTAPPGGLIVHSPAVAFSTAPSGAFSTAWAPENAIFVEYGTFLLQEGTRYVSGLTGAAQSSMGQTCCPNPILSCPTLGGLDPDAPSPICPEFTGVIGQCDPFGPDPEESRNAIPPEDGRTCIEMCPASMCDPESFPGTLPENEFGRSDPCLPSLEDTVRRRDICSQMGGGASMAMCACRVHECWSADVDPISEPFEPPECKAAECNVESPSFAGCCQRMLPDVEQVYAALQEELELGNALEKWNGLTPSEKFKLCLSRGGDLGPNLEGAGVACTKTQGHITGLVAATAVSTAFDTPTYDFCYGSPQASEDGRDCSTCGGAFANTCMPRGGLSDFTRWQLTGTMVEGGDGTSASDGEDHKTEGETSKTKPEKTETGGDPISLATGELYFSTTDVAFDAPGVPFRFERHYRSSGHRSGALGPGFLHSFEDYVTIVGDHYNRSSVPKFCVQSLPLVTCLYHNDSSGAKTLYVYDATSGVFVAEAGSFSTIRANRDGFILRESGGSSREYNVLGLLTAIRDPQGRGLTLEYRIREMEELFREGIIFGMNDIGGMARYDQRAYFFSDYARFGVPPSGEVDQVYENINIDERGRRSQFARSELMSVTDELGRTFDFTYVSVDGAAPYEHDDSEMLDHGAFRRRRLKSISLRETGAVLASYDYTWFNLTSDAYLEKVHRRGLMDAPDGLTPGDELLVTYERDFETIEQHFNFEALESEGGLLAGGSIFGQEIADVLEMVQADVNHCGFNIAVRAGGGTSGLDPSDGCQAPEELAGAFRHIPYLELAATVQRSIADNIIRVYTGPSADVALPDVETFFEVDPRSTDFDRAIKQRYGALPWPAPLPTEETRTDSAGGTAVVFYWASNLPETTISRRLRGDDQVTNGVISLFGDRVYRNDLSQHVSPDLGPEQPIPHPDSNSQWQRQGVELPEAILSLFPPGAPEQVSPLYYNPFEDPADCLYKDSLKHLPMFYLRKPAPPRVEAETPGQGTINITLSRYTCAEIAARQQRDAFANEGVRYFDAVAGTPFGDETEVFAAGQRRWFVELDAARVCQWVQTTRRDGSVSYHGLNFQGLTLVEAQPSPAVGTEWAVTLRRYNADGLLVEERRADGGATLVEYAGNPNAASDPFYERERPAHSVFFRPLATKITEVASPTAAIPAVDAPTGQTISELVTRLEYEPLYQQLTRVIRPDGITNETFYDYQQLTPADASQLAYFPFMRARAAGIPPDVMFDNNPHLLGIDLDGDGVGPGEWSAELVLAVQRDVTLGREASGATNVADVGTRYTRAGGSIPRVTKVARVSQWSVPSADFDVVELTYWRDLYEARTGDFEAGDQGLHGPLRSVARLRFPGAGSGADRDEVFFAYDALGGVRLEKRNPDPGTVLDEQSEVETQRDVLGRVVRTLTMDSESVFTHNERGELIHERHIDLTQFSPDREVRHAWAHGDFKLGTCTDLVGSATPPCAGWSSQAMGMATALRAGETPDAGPAGASWSLVVPDPEDRVETTRDSEGGWTSMVRNPAGLVEAAFEGGEPPLGVRFVYDIAGRVLSEQRFSGLLEAHSAPTLASTHARYDALGRLVDQQSGVTTEAFDLGVGLIAHQSLDLGGRPVEKRVEGADGDGNRKVLALTSTVYNESDAPLFVHRLTKATLLHAGAVTPPTSGMAAVAGDDWATERLIYDAALRPVLFSPEGRGSSTGDPEARADFDGFGMAKLTTPFRRTTWSRNPSRWETQTTVENLDDSGATASVAGFAELQDGRGRLITRERWDVGLPGMDGQRLKTEFLYDGLSQMLEVTAESGRRGFRTFDPGGRVIQLDEYGRSATISSRTTLMEYDTQGRPTLQTVGGQRHHWEWDVGGNLSLKATEPNVSLPDPAKVMTEVYERDELGRHAATTRSYGLGDTRLFKYDYTPRDPLEVPLGPSALTVFDSAPLTQGLAKEWIRDSLGRISTATDFNLQLASDEGAAPELAHILRSIFEYDSLGRVVEEQLSAETESGAVSYSATQAYSFSDDFFGPAEMTLPGGGGAAYEYLASGIVSGIERFAPGAQVPLRGVFDHVAGRWTAAAVDAGADLHEQTKIRNAFGWVTETEHRTRRNGSSVYGHHHEAVLRGPDGRIGASWKTGEKSTAQRTKGYRYDELDRLKAHSFVGAGTMSVEQFRSQALAALGNEDHAADSVGGPEVQTFFNLLDGLEGTSGPDEFGRDHEATFDETNAGMPPAVVGGSAIDLDVHHRVQRDGSLRYTFDVFDRLRLVEALDGADEISVLYDGLGRRRREVRRIDATTWESRWLHYEGPNVVREVDDANVVKAETLHAPGVDAPLAISVGGALQPGQAGVYALGTNVRGDVVSAVAYGGTGSAEEAELGPWGERTFWTGPSGSVQTCSEGTEGTAGGRPVSLPASPCERYSEVLDLFGIGGARAHPRTKLVDLRNRVYAPHLRGFLTTDPMGAVDSHGLWNYVAGDPVNFRDPWGLESSGGDAKVEGEAEQRTPASVLLNVAKKVFSGGASVDDAKSAAIALGGLLDKAVSFVTPNAAQREALGSLADKGLAAAGEAWAAVVAVYDEYIGDPIKRVLGERVGDAQDKLMTRSGTRVANPAADAATVQQGISDVVDAAAVRVVTSGVGVPAKVGGRRSPRRLQGREAGTLIHPRPGYRGPAIDPVPPRQGPFHPKSVGAARVWTKNARFKDAQLPVRGGKVRYRPPKNWHPSEPLPRGPQNGFMDKFGNEWTRGPSRTPGEAFEWDVQRPDGGHWNISLKGHVTHEGD